MAQDHRQCWEWARELLDTRSQRTWSSFSWITARALTSSLNDQVSRLTPTLVGELPAQWMARPEVSAETANYPPRLPAEQAFTGLTVRHRY